MKKRYLGLIFIFIIVFLISITILYNYSKTKKIYTTQDGVILSISDGNGGTLSSVPEQGPYNVEVDCTNGEGSWDYYNWKMNVKDITGNVTCELTFNEINSSQTFAQYIVSLAGTTQGDGQVVSENGYRYEGKDPNNYIWYNNEMWRIIGVFGSNGHNSGTSYVKIIRNQPIGGYAWNGVTDYPNAWGNSTLYNLLNSCYYNASDGNTETCEKACIGYGYSSTSVSGKCDFSVIGLQGGGDNYSYRDLVQSMTWYLGGPGKSGYTTYYPSNIYSYETNSSAVYSGRSISTTGYVGLMYLSDFGYGVLNSDCTRGTYSVNESYEGGNCANKNWLFGGFGDWTITQDSSTSDSVFELFLGATKYPAYGGMNVRPVVFLKTKAYKLDGTGTKTDPYIVGKNYEYENTFNYSSSVQSVQIAKAGYYKLEVYGAAGGTYNSATPGGAGGYAKGTIHLNKNDTLYIHTGGKGSYGSSTTMTTKNGGGTNGGGNASYRGGGGGGATDIRINTDSLYARVIVGGGGGGSYYYSNTYKAAGGNGGGTSGTAGSYYSSTYSAFTGKGGTSSAGGAGGTGPNTNYSGTAGSFGTGGASGRAYSTSYYSGGAGGGGWYGGGGAANYNGQSRNRAAGGGGGSSYTYTSSTASQCPSGCLLTSEYYMTSTSTTAGSNTGDGYAKVTYCGQSASDCS